MSLLSALRHASRFSLDPVFSLFHTSASGEFTTLFVTSDPDALVIRFNSEVIRPETCGLEVRCDGVRVQFDHN